MSQLNQTAEVSWLLELTDTIRPNSVAMSVAEEAALLRRNPVLQRWAHSVLAAFGLYRYLPSPDKVIVLPPKRVSVIVITRWIMNQRAPSLSCLTNVWKSWLGALLNEAQRKEKEIRRVLKNGSKHERQSFFFLLSVLLLLEWLITNN